MAKKKSAVQSTDLPEPVVTNMRELDRATKIFLNDPESETLRMQIADLEYALDKIEKPMKERICEAEKSIKESVLQLGNSASYRGIVATFRKPSIRRNWNASMLDDIMVKNPAMHGLLQPCRSESKIASGVGIKVNPNWVDPDLPKPEPVEVPF